MTAVESRLRDALFAGVAAAEESPDLFARIQLSIEDDRRRRRQRRRAAGIAACVLGAARGDRVRDDRTTTRRVAHGLVGTRTSHRRRADRHGVVVGAVDQAIRQELRGRRVPRQPADRQELHRAHRHRVLPDLPLVHHVHDAVRARRELGARPSTRRSSSTRPRASPASCSSSACCTGSTCWRCR